MNAFLHFLSQLPQSALMFLLLAEIVVGVVVGIVVGNKSLPEDKGGWLTGLWNIAIPVALAVVFGMVASVYFSSTFAGIVLGVVFFVGYYVIMGLVGAIFSGRRHA